MRRSIRLLFLLSAACIATAAQGADQSVPALPQLDEAYQQLLKNPQDETLLNQYADIAIEQKNYEAAIPPLESLLMSNPDDADLKVEIGTMYMNLGSKLMAKQYFEDAQNTEGASQDAKDKAKGYLREL